MALQERLAAEIKAAMLAQEADRLSTLRLLKSAVGYVLVDRKGDQLPDAEFVAVVQKEIKKRRDAVEQFERGGRPELAAKEKNEITVLETFLPAPLPPSELDQLVRDAIRDTGATSRKDMSAVIKAVQAKAAGRADGKTISGAVAKLLG